MEDIFQTPPVLSSASSFHKSQAFWELPPLNFDARAARKSSMSSILPSTPSLAPTPSCASLKPTPTNDTQRGATTQDVDAAEQSVLEQAGLIDAEGTPDGKRPGTSPECEESKDQVVEKEKLDRGKIRRSFHRTLREAHVPTHNRSRKGKDSSSSAGMSEESTADDFLSRGTGSFVVHGKKASVIKFGSELQIMSPEERLRLRKKTHKDEPVILSPAAIDDDFHSVLAEPYEYHERHGSAATTSTVTAKSFRDLNKKLYVHGAHNAGAVTSDGEDSEVAVSFSDGRRTPLPPVEDEDEEDSESCPGSHGKQAMFYTPEASTSPTHGPNEKHEAVEREEIGDNKAEDERLPSPALQAVVNT